MSGSYEFSRIIAVTPLPLDCQIQRQEAADLAIRRERLRDYFPKLH